MLMNDTTFLLDESMDTLKSIRELQDLMDRKDEWNELTRVLYLNSLGVSYTGSPRVSCTHLGYHIQAHSGYAVQTRPECHISPRVSYTGSLKALRISYPCWPGYYNRSGNHLQAYPMDVSYAGSLRVPDTGSLEVLRVSCTSSLMYYVKALYSEHNVQTPLRQLYRFPG